MHRFFAFFLDLLSKKTPGLEELEKVPQVFWKERVKFQKTADFSYAFFPYADKFVKAALIEIKARNNSIFLHSLTSLASEHLIEELSELNEWKNFTPTVIIPIPPSRKDKGFNHAEEIAKAFILNPYLSHLKLLSNILLKTKTTYVQHTLSKKKRLKNMEGSMSVRNSETVFNQDILLIDDITTTDATFIEARRVLLEAGARKVFCIALAH